MSDHNTRRHLSECGKWMASAIPVFALAAAGGITHNSHTWMVALYIAAAVGAAILAVLDWFGSGLHQISCNCGAATSQSSNAPSSSGASTTVTSPTGTDTTPQ